MEYGYVVIRFVIGAAVLIAALVARHRMKRNMQDFASANQFKVLKKGLPEGFLLRGTSLREAEITEVVRGEFRGSDIVLFNATFSEAQGRRIIQHTQTVVAFPNEASLGSRQVASSTGEPDLYFEVAGEWFVLYFRNRTIGKDKLNDWCEKMHGVTQDILSRVAA